MPWNIVQTWRFCSGGIPHCINTPKAISMVSGFRYGKAILSYTDGHVHVDDSFTWTNYKILQRFWQKLYCCQNETAKNRFILFRNLGKQVKTSQSFISADSNNLEIKIVYLSLTRRKKKRPNLQISTFFPLHWLK